ncbi:MAG TPA: hypothetical protein VN372_06955 [Methanospirillum sp.]|nr:hypothetical protein [Methanospirillum sp.]
MERRDIMVIAAAIIVVLILAVVVKPMLTGQPVNLGLPQSEPIASPTPPINEPDVYQTLPPQEGSSPEGGAGQPGSASTPQGSAPISQETMRPLPSATPVSWQPNPENPMPAIQMIEYADIVGKYTGNTSSFRIPTPYWEIAYNVTPKGERPVFQMDIVEKAGAGGEDKILRTMVYRVDKLPEPKEGRFFEGGRDYYLRIVADQVEKYRIMIRIPLKYLPDN